MVCAEEPKAKTGDLVLESREKALWSLGRRGKLEMQQPLVMLIDCLAKQPSAIDIMPRMLKVCSFGRDGQGIMGRDLWPREGWGH